jgi:hypothetical protein
MTTLYDRMQKVQTTNPYFKKDVQKAAKANKFIGQGSLASSTHKYMLAAGDLANTGAYEQTDSVFVSVEGLRRGRVPLNLTELNLAISAKVTFVADNEYDRTRPYNQGERELVFQLKKNGYVEVQDGIWKHSSTI